MSQTQSTELYGNVIEQRSNNVFAVALNIGDECDASIPMSVARDMFRVLPGDPVAIRPSTPSRLNRIVGFSPCVYYKRYWEEDSGGLCAGWGASHFLFEVHPDGWVSRQIQYFDNGELLLYDETCDEDDFGGRSTVTLDSAEYGPFLIDRSEFVSNWQPNLAANRIKSGGDRAFPDAESLGRNRVILGVRRPMSVTDCLVTASLDEKLRHFISFYHRGMLCPSECWHAIADVLKNDSADVSVKVSKNTIDLMQACRSERPHSFDDVAELRPELIRIQVLLDD
jgi:translation initiation factor IF-1